MTAFGSFDGRLDEFRERHRAIALQRKIQTCHSTGHRVRVGTDIRYSIQLRKELTGSQLRCRTRTVEENHTFLFGDVGEDIGVASYAGLMLFHDTGHVENRHSCIDRITTCLQNVHSRTCFHGMLSSHHAMGSHNDWSPKRLVLSERDLTQPQRRQNRKLEYSHWGHGSLL